MILAQRLHELDRSSARFPEQLNELLHDKEWVEHIRLLPEDELIELIGSLDDILDGLDRVGSPFRKCLHVLQKICSSRIVLPAAYEVPGALSFSTMEAVAYGGFCDIYKQSLGGADLCIKRLRLPTLGERRMTKQALCKEAVVWKRLNHPNVVPFKGVTFEPLQLVSEWMPGGALREYIENNRRTNLITLLLGVAEGLGYLHSCSVVHGDVKGANILVDAAGNARIADFGLAAVVRDSNSLVSTTGELSITARYIAPEILKGLARHSKESDVFSFGMVMVEVFTSNVPFSNLIAAAAIARIIDGGRPERPNHPSLTERLWTLIQQCWKENPQHRPRMSEVIKHLYGSADQVPRTISIQPVEPPMYENPELSPSTATTSYMAKVSNTTLLSPSLTLPQPPANFFGRDVIIDDVLCLVERFASLTLFGAGGIGKSAIALTLLHHDRIAARFGEHRHYMRCDGFTHSLDDFLCRLSEAVGAHHLRDLTQLQSHLSSSPCMLVLDGVDSFLDPLASGAAEIATAIGELGRCQNVCLLATSRMDVKIPDFRHIEVPTLSADGARDAFHSCCCLGRSAVVDNLLAELDFHPLSIDLLAGVVRENNWDEAKLLGTWNYGKTNILKVTGRQSLEDNIISILSTPTIRELGTIALEALEALAAFPDGVKESKLENMFPGITGIGEAANTLCKFSLMYRQDGFVKMLSPFRLYFLEPMQPMVPHPGSDKAHGFVPENIQYARRDVVSFGLPPVKIYPAEAQRRTHTKIGQQPGAPPEDKLIGKIRSSKRKLLAILRFSGGSNHLNRVQGGGGPADVRPPAATPHHI